MNSRIKVDFNNMLAANVSSGITEEEIEAVKKRIPEIHKGVCDKRVQNKWRDLPFNQDEIVEDLIALGKQINEKFENFVVLGIGGSALGSKALFTALKHPRYKRALKRKEGGRKVLCA